MERAPLLAGVVATLIGVVTLVGWWSELPALTSLVPGLPPTVPNSGLMVALAGAALIFLAPPALSRARWLAGKSCAGTVGLIAALTLAEYLTGHDLLIDRVLTIFWERQIGNPGRPSLQTAITLLLHAGALLTVDLRTKSEWRPTAVLALVSGVIPLTVLLGYLFGVASLYGPLQLLPYTGMGLPTAVATLVLSLGIALVRVGDGPFAILVADDSGGVAARQLVLWLLGLVPLVVAIAAAARVGWFSEHFAAAFITLSGIVAGSAFVLRISRRLSQLDRKQKAERQEVERLRQEWTAIVAHDLRQPVNTIGLAAQWLRRLASSELSPEGNRAVARIESSAARLARMINDLLDASRIESKRLTIEPRRVELRVLVDSVVEHLEQALAAHRVVVSVDSKLAVWVDPDRIHQVLGNLLSNAAKYGAREGEIAVKATSAGDLTEIVVTNRGSIIPPDQIALLFKRFTRTRSARESGRAGLGLGLYIAKGLVMAHGGQLWAESAPDGVTSFHFTVPAAPRPTEWREQLGSGAIAAESAHRAPT